MATRWTPPNTGDEQEDEQDQGSDKNRSEKRKKNLETPAAKKQKIKSHDIREFLTRRPIELLPEVETETQQPLPPALAPATTKIIHLSKKTRAEQRM